MKKVNVHIGRVVVSGVAGPVDSARLGRLLEAELGRRLGRGEGPGEAARVDLSRLYGTLPGGAGEAELAAELAQLLERRLDRRER